MKTEHFIGFVIILLLTVDVYLQYQMLQVLSKPAGGY